MSSSASPLPWEILRRWLLALGIFAALLFFFSPSWGAFRLAARVPELGGMLEVRRGASVLQQVEHPGAPIADPLHAAIQWRLLFPLLGHVFHLPGWFLFGLADVGCVVVIGYIITLLRRRTASWTACTFVALVLGATSWFYTSTGWLGYFDSWLAYGLLLVAFSPSWWVQALACVWTPWVDERFVLAFPLALLCRYLWFVQVADPKTGFDWKREAWIPSALVATFLVVRLGVLPSFSASGATVSGYLSAANYLDAPLSRIALGIWEGLRAAWVLVVLAVLLLRPHRGRALGLAIAIAAVGMAGLATAQDYSRTMTMLLPAAMLGALLTSGASYSWLPALQNIALAVALLFPAHHVMNDRVNPIYYLYHELAVIENPPAAAMPELYELRAIHEMERGEFVQADADLNLAIKLSDNPASPSKQRGILSASQHRWADARRDFSTMVEYDGKNPDAWFMRAQANLALGDPSAAQSDLQQALSLAPADWQTRPDVARFLANLKRTPAKP